VILPERAGESDKFKAISHGLHKNVNGKTLRLEKLINFM
jgi:hypothetical protein